MLKASGKSIKIACVNLPYLKESKILLTNSMMTCSSAESKYLFTQKTEIKT